MDDVLLNAARQYVAILEQMERTRDKAILYSLEEKRGDLHWKFMQLLKVRGIAFRDRDHATRIAIKMVRDAK